MDATLISVIMSVYNCEQYLHEAIESVRNQSYGHWELLACDDGSTDSTLAILKAYASKDPRVKVYQNRSRLKQLRTRNRLMRLAKGDFITFQDGDDYSDRYRFEKMLRTFEEDPAVALLSSQIGFINSRGSLIGISSRPTDYGAIMDLIYDENVIGGSMVMIRRAPLDAVGGNFRQYFDGLSYQDYDLSLLIAEKFKVHCLDEVLYFYRQHGESNSKVVHPDRLIAKQIVTHLAKQRRQNGTDDLMNGRQDRVDALFSDLRKPYVDDPSLVFRQYAGSFMYSKLYRRAIMTSLNGILRRPLSWVNWRTLQYCIRQSILSKISNG